LVSPLREQLAAGAPSGRPTAIDAFKLARHKFVAGKRVEMQSLADELGISRATLHRWVGKRDELLCEVLWSLTRPTLEASARATRAKGGERIADILERFLRDVDAAEYMRSFLEREPEIALRILTTKRTALQSRITAFIRELLATEVEAGSITPPLPLDDLAYVTVRIAESFMYTDIIARGKPDPSKAKQAIAALLRS
jgi:AcrR family transcriptional regulator